MSQIQEHPYESEDERNAIIELDGVSNEEPHLLKNSNPLSCSIRRKSQQKEKHLASSSDINKSKKVVTHFSEFSIS